jgi:hypothetical protein
MTLEEYQKRSAELGVGRGHLACDARFEDDGSVSASREPPLINRKARVGDRQVPPMPEQLSRLNPIRHAAGKESGKLGGQAAQQAKTKKPPGIA